MKNLKYTFIALLIISFFNNLSSQFIPLSIEHKNNNVRLIVEGRVTETNSFLAEDNLIYTENIIDVYNILKGTIKERKISIITLGGTIDSMTTTWTNLLSLNKGQYGAFYLVPSKMPLNENSTLKSYDVYSGVQGFYEYINDGGDFKIIAKLNEYDNITEFYNKANIPLQNRSVQFINNLYNDTCLQYCFEPLGFLNNNDPYFYFNISLSIKSGSYKLNRSEIQVEYNTDMLYENIVSNNFLIYNNEDLDSNIYNVSVTDLQPNILYFKINTKSNDFNDYIEKNNIKKSEKIVLRDLNGNGGYTIHLDEYHFNSFPGAKDAYKRALSTWRCATKVNFDVSEENFTNQPGHCFVTFSNFVPVGTLVTLCATSYNRDDCNSTEEHFKYSEGFLMRFNNNPAVKWYTGVNVPPPSGKIDFETVALHELGHGLILLHTGNKNDVMNTPYDSFDRTLDDDDKLGGNHITQLSSIITTCIKPKMNLIGSENCDITPVIDIDNNTIKFSVYPNPVKDKIYITISSDINEIKGKLQIINAFGTPIKCFEKISYGKKEFGVSKLSSGLYYITYVDKNKYVVGKFIKLN